MSEVHETVKNVSDWDVWTPSGWQPFRGVKRVEGKEHRLVTLEWEVEGNLQTLGCSGIHQVVVRRDGETLPLFADLVEVGDEVLMEPGQWVEVTATRIEPGYQGALYDLVSVGKDRVFFANGVAVHNCAHIREFEDLWAGLYPTLSTGGSCILISTPKGVGNGFHQIWADAKSGQNDFFPIELPWTVHPEHDETWFEQQKRNLKTERLIAQELLCSFESSGQGFLTGEQIRALEQHTQLPIGYWETNPDLWIWRHPAGGDKYLIACDISRGDSADFSAFHVVNLTTDQVVAEYQGKMQPDKLAELLVEVGGRYNNAVIAIENNGVGVATGYKLKELKYPNLYYHKHAKFGIFSSYDPEDIKVECPGVYMESKLKTEMLAYLDQTLRNQRLRVFSQRFFEELKTFVWIDNTRAKALKGHNDDLVMSLALACYLHQASGRHESDDGDLREIMLASIGRNCQTFSGFERGNAQSLYPTLPAYSSDLAQVESHYSPQAGGWFIFMKEVAGK